SGQLLGILRCLSCSDIGECSTNALESYLSRTRGPVPAGKFRGGITDHGWTIHQWSRSVAAALFTTCLYDTSAPRRSRRFCNSLPSGVSHLIAHTRFTARDLSRASVLQRHNRLAQRSDALALQPRLEHLSDNSAKGKRNRARRCVALLPTALPHLRAERRFEPSAHPGRNPRPHAAFQSRSLVRIACARTGHNYACSPARPERTYASRRERAISSRSRSALGEVRGGPAGSRTSPPIHIVNQNSGHTRLWNDRGLPGHTHWISGS